MLHRVDPEGLRLERVPDQTALWMTLMPAAVKAGRCGAGLLPAVSTTGMPDPTMTSR